MFQPNGCSCRGTVRFQFQTFPFLSGIGSCMSCFLTKCSKTEARGFRLYRPFSSLPLQSVLQGNQEREMCGPRKKRTKPEAVWTSQSELDSALGKRGCCILGFCSQWVDFPNAANSVNINKKKIEVLREEHRSSPLCTKAEKITIVLSTALLA